MITLDCKQGEKEWIDARLAVVTASEMHCIITPNGTKTVTTTSNDYMNKLLAEYLSGESQDSFSSRDMENGKDREEEARDYLAFKNDVEIDEVGLVYLNDQKRIACSPDGIISEDNGCEIKCPKGSTMISYLLSNKLPTFYIPQVQASMWITNRPYWTFLAYHSSMPSLIVTVERDDAYIQQMRMLTSDFIGKMNVKKKKLDIL